MRISVLLTYDNTFGRELIRTLLEKGMPITCIVAEKGTTLARNCESYLANDFYLPPKMEELLSETNIPVHCVRHHNSEECKDVLSTYAPDVVLLGGTRVLKSHIIAIPKLCMLNAHPGLLPKYRGMDVVMWSIYNNDPVGCTCHLVDAGVDSGDIILQKVLDYSDCKSIIEVRVKAMKLCVSLLIEAAQMLERHPEQKGVPQRQEEGIRHFEFPADKLIEVEKKIQNQYTGPTREIC